MRTLMILGAGIYQLPLIKTARNLGLRTIVVTPPGNYPGIQEADLWCDADTRDCEYILEIARAQKIDGICTSGTDVAVRSLGYVCDALRLPGITYEAARNATDKRLMKEAFQNHGVSTAPFRIAHDVAEARTAAKDIGLPVMMKATDSSGSRGISKVSREEDIDRAFQESSEITRNSYVIVEKFIEGFEIGVDGFVDEEGNPSIILPHGKFVYTTDAASIPQGHYFPLNVEKSVVAAIRNEAVKASQALGLSSCAFNSDVLINDDGVHVIEMGGRTGATCIPELISIHTGFNWYEKIIRVALGEQVSFDGATSVPCMAKILVSPITSRVESIRWKTIHQLEQNGVEVVLDVRKGDTIHQVENGTDRFGHVIVRERSEDQLDDLINRVESCIVRS